MVMIVNESRIEPALEALLDEEDQDHDGWAPVRPRRSSLPAPLSAQAQHASELSAESEKHAKPLNS